MGKRMTFDENKVHCTHIIHTNLNHIWACNLKPRGLNKTTINKGNDRR